MCQTIYYSMGNNCSLLKTSVWYASTVLAHITSTTEATTLVNSFFLSMPFVDTDHCIYILAQIQEGVGVWGVVYTYPSPSNFTQSQNPQSPLYRVCFHQHQWYTPTFFSNFQQNSFTFFRAPTHTITSLSVVQLNTILASTILLLSGMRAQRPVQL